MITVCLSFVRSCRLWAAPEGPVARGCGVLREGQSRVAAEPQSTARFGGEPVSQGRLLCPRCRVVGGRRRRSLWHSAAGDWAGVWPVTPEVSDAP